MASSWIKFAPLRVPLERRLQTLAIIGWFVTLGFGAFIGWILTFYLLVFTQWMRYLTLIYLCWVYYDLDIVHNGGRGKKYVTWMRSCSWWKYFCAYFPIKLVKTVDLDPSKNYLFCSFPHGMLASGAFGAFGTDGLGFEKEFPGLEPRIVTLEQHFRVPFFREFVLSFGACGSSAISLENVLREKEIKKEGELNKAVVLIVGGAAEAFKCKPSTYRIILNKRKGFVRIALKTGASLVPVFSFGETDLYDQIRNDDSSLLTKVQDFIKKVTGIAPVIAIGRGIFQYTYGPLPHRKPVTVVVGSPLEIPKLSEPTKEDIEKYHTIFAQKLIDLFESEKHKYLVNAENMKLVIE